MPTLASPAPDEHRPALAAEAWLRGLVIVVAAVALVLFAVLARVAWVERLHQAQAKVQRNTAIAREHALKVMRTNDALLGRVSDLVGTLDDAAIEAHAGPMRAAMLAMREGLPEVQGLSVIDAQGRVLVAASPYAVPPRMDVSQRAYFSALRDGTEDGLYLSAPLRGRIDPSEMRIVSSRARHRADGSFAGVIALSLRASAFDAFYLDLLQDTPGGSVALFRRDGTVITRVPLVPEKAGLVAPASGPMMQRVAAGAREGMLDIVSPFDGKRRLTSFRTVEAYGLLVSATVSHEAILAAWRRDAMQVAAFILPSAAGLVALTWLALRHTRRERLATTRWIEESARRLQAEEALRQTQRMEALGHLTGGVAHDVNNLLMVVSNNAFLIRRQAGQRDVTPQVDAILRAVSTGSRLTRQLLAFARRQAFRPEVVDLAERQSVLRDLMRHSIPTQISLEVQVAPGTPCVRVDPAELELALINLAVNARDAMPGGGTLRMDVHADTAANQVVVAVSDTGTGIAPEHLGRVFEPFYTTKAPGSGTGLGLSQVSAFCQQAGGEARLSSAQGRGTTVEMRLPAVADAPRTEAPASSILPEPGGRLLLVEDNAEIAAATVPLLEGWRYEVDHAPDGQSAYARLEAADDARQPYDLLLSDIVMPGPMDGVALARETRRRFPATAIVLMTGYANQTSKAIADDFVVLQKPWMPETLADALAQALAERRRAGRSSPGQADDRPGVASSSN